MRLIASGHRNERAKLPTGELRHTASFVSECLCVASPLFGIVWSFPTPHTRFPRDSRTPPISVVACDIVYQ